MRERSPGVWQLRVSTGVDPITGATRPITATHRGNRKSAAAALAELAVKHRHSGPRAAGTVSDLIAAWLDVAPIGATTRDVYDDAVAHLPPAFGRRKIDSVTSVDVARLYRHLSEAGVGAWTVRKLHTVMSGAFRQAMRWEMLVRNPCSKVELPAVQKNTRIPTDDEVGQLFDAATPQERVLLATAIALGGRRGEMVALRWSHLDLDNRRARIAESITVKKEVKTTKTKRDDWLPLSEPIVEILRDWRIKQKARAEEAGVPYSLHAYVLSDALDAGKPWQPNLATHRFIALRDRAGVTGVRLHDMRHAAASHLLASGLDIVAVSKHMRHSRVSTTLDVYGHVLAGRDQQVANVLGDLLKRTSGRG